MNWNPTENCFLTTYHSSFMVHCWPSFCATYSSSYCARVSQSPFLSLRLSPRRCNSPSIVALRATANSHLPKRACHVQVDGNVVSGNQIQVLREKAKHREREREWNDKREVRIMLFFHHLVWCFLDKERKGGLFMVDMVFLVSFYCGLFAEKNLFFVLPYY